jgi:type II secretory pathway pseudopilin PulG
MRTGKLHAQSGFTYLGLLFMVAVMGVGLAAVGEVWQTVAQREKEKDLLLAGREIRKAIGRYHSASAGGWQRYPASLDDLLKDSRFPGVRRHMRSIPMDPMTSKSVWETIPAPGGGVMGVHSRSNAASLKSTGFDPGEEGFEGKETYNEWKFVFVPKNTPLNMPFMQSPQGVTRR